MKYLFIPFCILILTGGAAFYSYTKGFYRFNYPEFNKKYPVHGLDVSHHQGQIDWSQVANSPYKFVYIKATEGGDFKDRLFQKNWTEAQKNGLKVGAYHFFTLCRDGATQAQNMIDSVPAEQDTLPHAIDLEYVGNCSKRPTKQEFEKELDTFIQKTQRNFQEEPILYTTYDFYEDYLKDTPFASYPIWLRNVFSEPGRKKINNWVVWQYADNEVNVPGIKGRVDLNAIPENSSFLRHF